MSILGGCLCGAVSYECAEEHGGGHCHCNDCRRTSGTGHSSHMIVPEAGFTIEGEVRAFEKPADSGNMVRRHFCPACGSPVYSTNSAMAGLVFLRASSLDDPENFHPQMVVYTDRAASWDRMDAALPAFSTMPQQEELPAAMK
jgi:hypothetical protein